MQKKEEAYGEGEWIIQYMKNSNKEQNKIIPTVTIKYKDLERE